MDENEQKLVSPRQRLRQLLAISDNERTDAEWDELNELEISLSPVNRIGAPEPVSAGQGGARKRGVRTVGVKSNSGRSNNSKAPQGKVETAVQADSGKNMVQGEKPPAQRKGVRKFYKHSGRNRTERQPQQPGSSQPE